MHNTHGGGSIVYCNGYQLPQIVIWKSILMLNTAVKYLRTI